MAAADVIAKVLIRLRLYYPEPGATALPWDHPLVRSGYGYVYKAAVNEVRDQLRQAARRKIRQEREILSVKEPTVRSLEAYLRTHERHLTLLWKYFDVLCYRTADETLSRLIQCAREFGCNGDLVQRTLFFDCFLNKRGHYSGQPGDRSILAHLGLQLPRLDSNALYQRKYRLKRLWNRALDQFQQHLSKVNLAA
jgi:hypothetical protein